MNRALRIAAAVIGSIALCITACSATPDENEHGDLEGMPENSDAQRDGLSSIDCSTSTETGYKNGSPFPITVVTIDGKQVEKDSANAYYVMAQAAAKDGVHLSVVSGFRTMAKQKELYSCFKNCNCNNCNPANQPGYSNHQSGHAFDLNTSAPGVLNWLNARGGKFGFKRTVPKEEWHWEWWGGGPGGGPCGGGATTSELNAEYVGQGSTGRSDFENKAYFQVCAGEQVTSYFDLRNTGSVSWADSSTPATGRSVRLGVPTDKPDNFAGTSRISLNSASNIDVRPEGGDCFNKLCNRTRFLVPGTAPQTPGVYTTTWQLVDEGRAWFGPVMSLTYNVVDCNPGAKSMATKADVNGDGKADLVNVFFLNPGIRIALLLSNGDGTFTQKWQDPWPGYTANDAANWKVADVNGDGKADLVNLLFWHPGLRVAVLLSNGDGTWTPKAHESWPDYPTDDVSNWKIADINGDKRADLVNVVFWNPGLAVAGLLSNGDGTWVPTGHVSWPGYAVNDVTNWKAADINGDGRTDLVDVFYLNPGIRIHALLSNGNGTFTQKAQDPWPGYGTNDVTNWKVADVNGDGKADLVDVFFMNPSLRIHTLVSNGDGTWQQKAHDPWPGYAAADSTNWKVADINGDGKADLTNVIYWNPGLAVAGLLSSGNGTWSPVGQAVWPGYGANDVANWKVADIDGDGKADLVDVFHLAPGLRIHSLRSQGNGGWTPASNDPWPGYAANDVTNWKVAH